MKKTFWIIIALLLVLGGCSFSSYNGLVEAEEQVNQQWSQVEVQYQRRADLIGNLVETVKANAEFEEGTLSGIAEARAQVGLMKVTKEVLDDPQAFERFTQAQSQLGGALSRLLSVSEKYPELRANEAFQGLMVQLEGTENRIARSRQQFNEVAQAYNTKVRKFPAALFANLFGFDTKQYFQASEGSQAAPEVNFD